MTPYSSPPSAQRPVPAAARLAIVVLMAGALVYGWQSADVGQRESADSRAFAPSPDSGPDTALKETGPASKVPSAQLLQPAAASAARTSPSSDSTIFEVLDCTPLWIIGSIVLAYLFLRSRPSRLQQTMSWLNEHGAMLLVLLFVFLLSAAAIGFYGLRHPETTSAAPPNSVSERPAGNQNVLHDVYQILQLLNFNTETGHLTGFLLAAAMAAALIAILAAREILQVLFYDFLVRLQLLQAENHIVVCGLGRLGRQIIETLLSGQTRDRRLIVVLERDPQNPNLKWARQKGLLLVQGDGAETEDQQRVRMLEAHEVFLCAGADEVNIACLTAILETHKTQANGKPRTPVLRSLRSLLKLNKSPTDLHRPRCYAHIMNHDLLRAVRLFEQKIEHNSSTENSNGQKLRQSTRRPDIEIFSTPERTIWKLMTELGAVKAGRTDQSTEARIQNDGAQITATADTWHYILLGFGEFGRSLAISLAEHSHTESGKRIRMTICDRDIDRGKRAFLSRYSQFCMPDRTADGDSDWWNDAAPDAWSWVQPLVSPAAVPTEPGGTSSQQRLLPLSWVCRADFLDYHEVSDDLFVNQLIARSSPAGVRVAVFVCFDDEKDNFTISLRLQQKLKDRILQLKCPKPDSAASAGNIPTAESLSWPIFAWLPRQLKLATLLGDIETQQDRQQAANNTRPNLMPFGQNYENISYSEITHSWLDWLARLIHLVWDTEATCPAHLQLISLVRLREDRQADGQAPVSKNPWERVFLPPWHSEESAPDTAAVDHWLTNFQSIDWGQLEATADLKWRDVDESLRYSNRSAAIHSVLKAAPFGLQIVGRADPHEICAAVGKLLHAVTYGRLRKLSEMEHNRWVAERLLEGWWFHLTRTERTRWQLTPFEYLTANPIDSKKQKDTMDQREKDARIIMLVLGLMAAGRLKTKPLNDS